MALIGSRRAFIRRTLLLAAAIASPSWLEADEFDFFETRIRPVLVKHCYECHSAASAVVQGELLLDSREGLRKGGESGPSIVPGVSDESMLLQALRYESFEMPPGGPLPAEVVADFARWIEDGAADPRDRPPSATEAAEAAWTLQLAERSRWWSLQPLVDHPPPLVTDEGWSGEPVDRFIRSALDQAGLSPAAEADAETLLRRLSLALTGLPPAADEVKRFPEAYQRDADAALTSLVDRLLASPSFGERFARHWMDVVRYTDTYGYEWDNPAKGSWEYRDYLIRAFNDDVPFDGMIREQIAGDLLPEPRLNHYAGVNESFIGPMFYHLGEHRHGSSLDFNGIHQDMVNNKIDAFSQAFLAMTVACARCHDHKLDAVSQADYYAMAGVMMSPRWTTRVIDLPGAGDELIAELKQLRQLIQGELARLWTSPASLAVVGGPSLRQWASQHSSSFENAQLGDVTLPLARLAGADEATITEIWEQLQVQWSEARDARLALNAERFTTIADFRAPGFPEGWAVEGDGLAHGFVTDGAALISLEGEPLVDRLLSRGYHTHALSSKLPGSLRLPAQDRTPGAMVSLNLAGGEWSAYFVVPQNAFQNEPMSFLDPAAPPRWTTIADSALTNGVTRVCVEVTTAPLHPNFPPRTGLARAGEVALPDNDLGLDKRSWFSLTGIVAHDAAGAPEDELDVYSELYTGETPENVDEAWRRVEQWFARAIQRWAAGNAAASDVALLNWLLQKELLPNRAGQAPQVAALVNRYRQVEAKVAFPRTVISMDERGVEPVDYRLNVRGDVDRDGEAVRRDFLAVFAGAHDVSESPGSGRLELAEYLANPHHPQAARVYVNRVWHWVFGSGIVATPNDFGKLGDRPSHPELLDWLARRFVDEGWSTKKLVRRLVLSRTFRQSGRVAAIAAERDPNNRLLHHYPTRRLEAEAVRDGLLAVSGRLDARFGGPPVKPPRAVEDAPKRLFSGPLDGQGRRSVYLEMSIMAPPGFLVGFNLPDLRLPTGRRDVTNVPAQALILLNDPFVAQAAMTWSQRMIDDGFKTPRRRVRAMFVEALGREPSDEESRRWSNAVVNFSGADDCMRDANAWADLAHALFNSKEFVYYR